MNPCPICQDPTSHPVHRCPLALWAVYEGAAGRAVAHFPSRGQAEGFARGLADATGRTYSVGAV